MVIFDDWTEKYTKIFPDDTLDLEYFDWDRGEDVIDKFEQAFRENKPLSELYPEIKRFVILLKTGMIKTI